MDSLPPLCLGREQADPKLSILCLIQTQNWALLAPVLSTHRFPEEQSLLPHYFASWWACQTIWQTVSGAQNQKTSATQAGHH